MNFHKRHRHDLVRNIPQALPTPVFLQVTQKVRKPKRRCTEQPDLNQFGSEKWGTNAPEN